MRLDKTFTIAQAYKSARTVDEILANVLRVKTSFPQYLQKLKRKKIHWGAQHAGEMLHQAIKEGKVERIESRNWSLAVKYISKSASREAQG